MRREGAGDNRLNGPVGLLLGLLLTSIAYWPSLGNGFPYDDAYVVAEMREDGSTNPMVAELRSIHDYFATEYWEGTGSRQIRSLPLYRPVTVCSFALTHALISGDGSAMSEAFPHHLVNFLLQLVNMVLVFLIARRFVGRGSIGPTLAAATFGVAAIHSEAVAAIVGRADLLAFGFGAGALLCCMGCLERRRESDTSIGRQVLSGTAASLLLFSAFCSKESGLAWWPFLVCVALARGWQSSGSSLRTLLLPAFLGIGPAVAWYCLRQGAFDGLPPPDPVPYASNPLHHVSLGQRIAAALAIQGRAIVTTLVPIHPVSDYGARVFSFAEPGGSFGIGAILWLLAWVATVAAGIVALWCRRALLFLGSAAIVGFGLVTSNAIIPIGTIYAERLSYLPSLGLVFLVLWFEGRFPRSGWVLSLIGLYVLYSATIVFTRVGDWKDDRTLFSRDVVRQPHSLTLNLQAAVQALRAGDSDAWRRLLEAAIGVEPEWGRAYVELGGGLIVQNKPEEAKAVLRRGLEAKILEPFERRMLWQNMGIALAQLGKNREALTWLRKALRANPKNAELRHQILTNARSFPDPEVLEVLSEGESLEPNNPLWQVHRGLRWVRHRQWIAAVRDLKEGLARVRLFDSAIQHAWLELGDALRQTGNTGEALRLFRQIAKDERFAESLRKHAAKLGGQ